MSDPLWCVWSINEVWYSTPQLNSSWATTPLHGRLYVMLLFMQGANAGSPDFSFFFARGLPAPSLYNGSACRVPATYQRRLCLLFYGGLS